MEPSNIKSTTTDARLVALQARNKKATFFFTFFLVSVFLFMAGLFTYLILDIYSKSMEETTSLHSSTIINSYSEVNASLIHSPIAPNPNHTLASLQTAAERLQNVTFFLKSIPGLTNCSDRVNMGLAQIQDVIAWPSDTTMRWKIGTVEWYLEQCLNDLGKMELESREVREAKAKVTEAWESVRKCWDLAAAAEEWRRRVEENKWGWLGEMMNVENVLLFVLGTLEIAFLGVLLCCACIMSK